MLELSMHIMDIVENSVVAGANHVEILMEKNREKDLLNIEIKDNGKGMDKEMQNKIMDPFVTTKTGKKIGLGVAMLSEAVKRAGGELKIDSLPGRGTTVKAMFVLSNIDRQPLGDIVNNVVTLIIGYPNVYFVYTILCDGKLFSWNTEEIRTRFGNVPRSSPEIIDLVRNEIGKGIGILGEI